MEKTLKMAYEPQPFRVNLSLAAIIIIFGLSSAISFLIGYVASQDIQNVLASAKVLGWDIDYSAIPNIPDNYTIDPKRVHYHNVQPIPQLIHASFGTLKEAVVDVEGNVIATDRLLNQIDGSENINKTTAFSKKDDDDPIGYQLGMDLENIESTFIASLELMGQALLDILAANKMSALSSRCHGVEPQGVSCMAILPNGLLSLQTWPSFGTITLDLFTFSEIDVEELKPKIEKIFGLAAIAKEIPFRMNVKWSYKQRGFHLHDKAYDGHNLGRLLENNELLKRKIASVKTDFQTIDVYEQINLKEFGRFSTSAALGESESIWKAVKPDKLVFLNGVLQSRLHGEAAYHEALVHPAMMSHPEPKRVAIIGGGEGATLREVLKHKTVETVTMVEIDEGVVNASKQFLPEWSDCSNLVGSADSCFDDPRTELHFTDAAAWFIERFGELDKFDEKQKYDVIIMDSLDPLTAVGFSDSLFHSDSFVGAIHNALTDAGVFVAEKGEEVDMRDYPEGLLSETAFIVQLRKQDYESIKDYEEGNSGLFGVWSFRIAFKDTDAKMLWHQNQGEIDYDLHHRALDTKDGSSAFRFFDGATMMTYQYPSRTVEHVFCLSQPTPELCENDHGFDPYIKNVNIDDLEVKPSTIPGAGRGLFFKKDFPAGSYVAIDEGTNDIMFMQWTTNILKDVLEIGLSDKWKVFDYYTFGYGFSNDFYGDAGFSVDPSIMTFINHGCNQTYNMGVKTSVTELTADPIELPPELLEYTIETAVYNPFIDRNHLVYLNGYDRLHKDVNKGEELMDNYLSYLNEYNWESGLADYKAQCLRQAAGAITEYESEHKGETPV